MMKSDTHIHIRVPSEVREAAQQRASELGLSLTSYVKLLIMQDQKK